MKYKKDSGIWFSYKQKRYFAKKVPKRFLLLKKFIPQSTLFKWSDEPKIWDWKNCHFSIIGMDKDRVRIAARRQKILKRTDHLSGEKIWLMLGIIATDVAEIKLEDYNEPVEHNPPNRTLGKSIKRWVFHITIENHGDKEAYITDATIWCKSNSPEPPNDLVRLHKKIIQNKGIPKDSNIFEVDTDHEEKIFPVIYQPRVDTHNNYIRSIFWHKKGNEIEFSLVFNDEELNNSWYFDFIYRHFRRWKYGRIKDLESFSVILENQKATSLIFPGIYSNDDNLKNDSTHGDKESFGKKAPLHDIKYFYADTNHPIIFVNTSNHAMAEHDNNHQFWKWEYVGWEEDTPLIVGGGSKDAADTMLKEQAIREKPCN